MEIELSKHLHWDPCRFGEGSLPLSPFYTLLDRQHVALPVSGIFTSLLLTAFKPSDVNR